MTFSAIILFVLLSYILD